MVLLYLVVSLSRVFHCFYDAEISRIFSVSVSLMIPRCLLILLHLRYLLFSV